MSDLIGQRLGHYELIDLLGKGGMATVYRARQETTKRNVAIKVIRADQVTNTDFVKRFQREAEVIASLSHPHIVKIFDYGQHEGVPYMVMELLTGGNLADLISGGPMTAAVVGHVLDQIAPALSYAHQRGVIHRDLKPKNVLMDMDGNLFLADFGIARLMTDVLNTQTGTTLGTPAYMPPEQWRGATLDQRADVYALGVILFEMLAGQRPYLSETPFTMMHMHLFNVPPSLRGFRSDIPARIDQVIDRALAKAPEARYGSATALAAAYRDVVTGNEPPIRRGPTLSPNDETTITFGRIMSPSEQGHYETAPTTLTLQQFRDQEKAVIARLKDELANAATIVVPGQTGADKPESPKTGRGKTGSTNSRVINTLPQDIRARFKDRFKQQADIVNRLLDKTPLVSIYGRGGIGKTALACKVLSDLQSAQDDSTPDGMIYLSASRRDSTDKVVSLDRIVSDFGKLLTGDAKVALEIAWRDPQMPLPQKLGVLLDQLQVGRYVLLLDNLETLQDPDSYALTDPDLQLFFEMVLEQGSGLSILITSRAPLALPRLLKTREYPVHLDEGLPLEDAIALLRTFDPGGAAGLRDAPVEKLQLIAEKTHSYPRALEAVAGLLLADALYDLDDLLQDETLFANEVTPYIVKQVIERLRPESIRILEVLALLGRPVSQSTLEFMLAPYMQTEQLRGWLNLLTQAYFVSFNKAVKTFALHPIDLEYCYSRIPIGTSTMLPELTDELPHYTRHVLHLRAAAFYSQQRTLNDDWKTIDDLAPQLAEFDHRAQAGDSDNAARLLSEFRDALFGWGHYAYLLTLYEQINGKIADRQLARNSLGNLGRTYVHLGRTHDAIIIYEQVLVMARTDMERTIEALCLDNLGIAYYTLGKFERAIAYYKDALAIAREVNHRQLEGRVLNNLGVADYALGNLESGTRSYEQALLIYDTLDDLYGKSAVLNNLGEVQMAQGNYPTAIAYLNSALTLADGMNYGRGVNYFGSYLAAALLLSDAIDEAQAAITQAQFFDTPENNHIVTTLRGLVLLRQGDWAAAHQAFLTALHESADLLTRSVGLYEPLYTRGLAYMGLTLAVSDDAQHFSIEAIKAYEAARAVCIAQGMILIHARLIDLFIHSDGRAWLLAIKQTLIGT